MNKAYLAIGALVLSNLTIEPGNIEDESSFQINFNTAMADDTEVIKVYGTRYNGSTYTFTAMSALDNDSYNAGNETDTRQQMEETEQGRLDKLCDLKPDGCNQNNLPSLASNGCSTELAGFDFFNGWDAVFVSACNSHDQCFVDLSNDYRSCNSTMRQDMIDICSVRDQEARNGGYLFQTSECWNKSSEYFTVVSSLIGASKYADAQQDAACVFWDARMDGRRC
jgi:hypothetical protein